eukprot:2171515-Prymnesium_polylepis.1
MTRQDGCRCARDARAHNDRPSASPRIAPPRSIERLDMKKSEKHAGGPQAVALSNRWPQRRLEHAGGVQERISMPPVL